MARGTNGTNTTIWVVIFILFILVVAAFFGGVNIIPNPIRAHPRGILGCTQGATCPFIYDAHPNPPKLPGTICDTVDVLKVALAPLDELVTEIVGAATSFRTLCLPNGRLSGQEKKVLCPDGIDGCYVAPNSAGNDESACVKVQQPGNGRVTLTFKWVDAQWFLTEVNNPHDTNNNGVSFPGIAECESSGKSDQCPTTVGDCVVTV